MSQAEIAGGKITQDNELPTKGRRLREFTLENVVGTVIHFSDFRGRANLVLIVGDQRPETERLMADLAARYSEIKNDEAEILAIVHTSREAAAELKHRMKLPYPVLVDADGRMHCELGAVDSDGIDSAAVYVTDRFGEVFGIYSTTGGQPLPGIADILNWLAFVNAQCPECEPPEWPV